MTAAAVRLGGTTPNRSLGDDDLVLQMLAPFQALARCRPATPPVIRSHCRSRAIWWLTMVLSVHKARGQGPRAARDAANGPSAPWGPEIRFRLWVAAPKCGPTPIVRRGLPTRAC